MKNSSQSHMAMLSLAPLTKLSPQIAASHLCNNIETTTSITVVNWRLLRLVCHGSLEPGGPALPYHAYEEKEEEEKEESPFPSFSQISYLGSWQGWVVGVFLSVVVPFWATTLPLLKLKNEVETAVEVADIAAQLTEVVAEKAEEMAEDAVDKMPEGDKYKGLVISIQMLAKTAAKDAELAQDFLDKVKKVENEVDAFIGDEEGDPIDSALEKVEGITEVMEKVAERVEKAAEEEAERLPDGGMLKAAAIFTENAAKSTAKNAHEVEETIEKVEEEKEKVETIIGERRIERIIRFINRR